MQCRYDMSCESMWHFLHNTFLHEVGNLLISSGVGGGRKEAGLWVVGYESSGKSGGPVSEVGVDVDVDAGVVVGVGNGGGALASTDAGPGSVSEVSIGSVSLSSKESGWRWF
jgi:hypothetical protein